MRQFRYVFVLTFLLVVPPIVKAQDAPSQPVPGVVWMQPPNFPAAYADLMRMQSMGIRAVRTGPVASEELLAVTDTLGMRVYQTLPVSGLPAKALRDTLGFARRTVLEMLSKSVRHPSARTFGLAYGSDTSDPAACNYFEELANLARQAAGNAVRLYYVTRFVESDRCGSTVDFVLLDALQAEDPMALLRRWNEAHPEVPAGLAAVGAFVRDDEAEGVRIEGSPHAQARRLEQVLGQLFDERSSPRAEAVFVYRWRDITPDHPTPAFDLENPYRHAFGLFRTDGQPRPAANVVAGIFGRGQDVFAYPAGPAVRDDHPLTTLAGWIVLVVLGIAFASSPRLRPMVPRYFSAHGFYREAVREGRDVLLTASIVLLVSLSLAVAIIWLVVLDAWRTNPQFLLLFDMLPQGIQDFHVTILGRPVLFLLLVGSLYGASLTVWSAMLAFASRRRYPLSPAQALMLAIWPRWAVLLLMLAAMVVATLPENITFLPATALLGVWVLITLWAMARTLYDYATVTRVPAGQLALAMVLNPLVLILIILLGLGLRYHAETMFLWHAVTRT